MKSISKPRLPIEIYTTCQNLSPEEFRKKSLKKPPLSFKKWGFKFSLPYLPSEQGDWRAYFYGDDTRMGGNVKSQKGESPIIKKGRVISDPAFALWRLKKAFLVRGLHLQVLRYSKVQESTITD
jgi:hypothetical protein